MTLEDGQTFLCCGVRINALPQRAAVERVIEAARSKVGSSIHLCNAYVLALASRDESYRTILNRGTLRLPDGTPVVWVGRRRGATMRRPVRGKDLFLGVVDEGRRAGLRHYLYGGAPAVTAGVERALSDAFPGAVVAGAESPPYRALTQEEKAAVVARLLACAADVVWVGLGTPRQDEWCDELSREVNAAFVAVGAAFDFVAGAKREAPLWMRGKGLEWLHRLATEPRRLWRRYLVGNVLFAVGIFGDRRRTRC